MNEIWIYEYFAKILSFASWSSKAICSCFFVSRVFARPTMSSRRVLQVSTMGLPDDFGAEEVEDTEELSSFSLFTWRLWAIMTLHALHRDPSCFPPHLGDASKRVRWRYFLHRPHCLYPSTSGMILVSAILTFGNILNVLLKT
jgi:hypothetical protein